MSVTPTGSPAWTRVADHTTYGGDTDKKNYQSQGAVNARTDVTAEQFVRLASDAAMVVQTADLAVLIITGNDTAANDPTVNSAYLMTGRDTTGYDGGNPPAGFPSVTRVADGHMRVTFATSLTDDYGVSGIVDIIGGGGAGLDTASGTMAPNVIPLDSNSDGYYEAADVYWPNLVAGAGVALDTAVILRISTGQSSSLGA